MHEDDALWANIINLSYIAYKRNDIQIVFIIKLEILKNGNFKKFKTRRKNLNKLWISYTTCLSQSSTKINIIFPIKRVIVYFSERSMNR